MSAALRCLNKSGVHSTEASRLRCPVHGNGRERPIYRPINPAPVMSLYVLESDAIAAAKSEQTSAAALRVLASDKSIRVRLGVAKNPNCPDDTAWSLADDREARVRLAVTEREVVDPDVLAYLAGDDESFVRSCAIKNPLLPLESLLALAEDDDHNVRRAVLGCPWTPGYLIAAMETDKHPDVRRAQAHAKMQYCRREFGIAVLNTGAREYILAQRWWELERDSPDVEIALSLSPNPLTKKGRMAR